MRAVAARRLLLPLLLLALAGCGGSEEDGGGPEDAAALVVGLAATGDPTDGRLLELFAIERLEDERAGLLDALAGLAHDGRVVTTVAEPLSGPDEVVVDLGVELPGGGAAQYSVQLLRGEGGDWRITWFSGPGVEWPSSGRRDDGLTVSSTAKGYNQEP